MPFYEALKYILTTTSGKVKRISWLDRFYITREYMNGIESIVLVSKGSEGRNDIKTYYSPTKFDIVADDWKIVLEE